MRWKTAYGTNATSSSAAATGARQTSSAKPATATATTIHPSGGAAQGPTSDAMMPSAIRRGVGLLRKMSRPVNCSAAWPAKAARYCASPPLAMTSGIAQASTPIENVIALPRSAPAAPRPARSSSTERQQRERQPDRLRAHADREPRDQRAGDDQSARLRDRRRICAVGERRRRTNAIARHACAASAMPSPGMSLSGRSAVNQNSGDATTTSVASAARRSRACVVRRAIQRLDASEQRDERKHGQRAEQRAPDATANRRRTARRRATACRAR